MTTIESQVASDADTDFGVGVSHSPVVDSVASDDVEDDTEHEDGQTVRFRAPC